MYEYILTNWWFVDRKNVKLKSAQNINRIYDWIDISWFILSLFQPLDIIYEWQKNEC